MTCSVICDPTRRLTASSYSFEPAVSMPSATSTRCRLPTGCSRSNSTARRMPSERFEPLPDWSRALMERAASARSPVQPCKTSAFKLYCTAATLSPSRRRPGPGGRCRAWCRHAPGVQVPARAEEQDDARGDSPHALDLLRHVVLANEHVVDFEPRVEAPSSSKAKTGMRTSSMKTASGPSASAGWGWASGRTPL